LDIKEQVMSKLSRWLDKNVTHKTATQESIEAAAEQIDFYKKQKDNMEKENARITEERKVENQRIHEKQLRSLRRRYSSSKFLDNSPSTDLNSTLG
jgi:hypothetical protein